VLSDDEIAEIWHATGATRSPFGTIVRLFFLTGQRRGEVVGCLSETSDDRATWTMFRCCYGTRGGKLEHPAVIQPMRESVAQTRVRFLCPQLPQFIMTEST
jgi:hypothetical protein